MLYIIASLRIKQYRDVSDVWAPHPIKVDVLTTTHARSMAPRKRHNGSTYSSKRPKGSAAPAASATNEPKMVFIDGEEVEEISGGRSTMNDVPCGANEPYGGVEVDFGHGISLVLQTPPDKIPQGGVKDKRKGSK